MNQSRLSSWPTYGWYSHGSGPPSYGVPLYLRYQATTVSSPSGVIDGTISTTTESSRRGGAGGGARWEGGGRAHTARGGPRGGELFLVRHPPGRVAPRLVSAAQVSA